MDESRLDLVSRATLSLEVGVARETRLDPPGKWIFTRKVSDLPAEIYSPALTTGVHVAR